MFFLLCTLHGTHAFAAAAPPFRLSSADARHLLLRSGFAPSSAEVDALAGQPMQEAVDALVAAARIAPPLYPAPGFVALPPPLPQRLLKTMPERQAARQQQSRESMEIRRWWIREMVETPVPLRERMTLFWHNHFATSEQKVASSQAMWRQQQTLRAEAVGNFRSLLQGIAKDPAMLVYLDGSLSRKGAPNENFAREAMELFTLGESGTGSRYTETDIREAARAFTGWTVRPDDFTFRHAEDLHDDGPKTVLGQTGAFGGDDVLDILLAQPSAARFIVGKLWKEFVSPTPDSAEVDRIAQAFRQSNHDIGTVLRALFTSEAFWAASNRASLVKSPIDLVVGTVRQFGFNYSDATPFAVKSGQLGQNLLAPPNVKGWPGQNDWITTTTLLERKRFTEQLFRTVRIRNAVPGAMPAMAQANVNSKAATGAAAMAGTASAQLAPRGISPSVRDGVLRVGQGVAVVGFDPDAWLAAYGAHTDREPGPAARDRLAQALLAAAPTQAIASGTVGLDYLRMLTLDPAYQLK